MDERLHTTAPEQTPVRRYLTRSELAARTGFSALTIHRYTRDGKIPHYQPGGKGAKVLYPPDAIEIVAAQTLHDTNPCTPPRSSPKDSAVLPAEHAAGPKLPGPRPGWQQRRRNNKG